MSTAPSSFYLFKLRSNDNNFYNFYVYTYIDFFIYIYVCI